MKSYVTYPLYIAAVLAMISCSDLKTSGTAIEQQSDSIGVWLQEADNIPSEERLPALEKIYSNINELSKEDTVKLNHLGDLSFLYSETTDTSAFRKTNKAFADLALKLNDSLSLAGAYWDLGDYMANKLYKADSAFYYYAQAYQIYDGFKDGFASARMLINMAIQQQRVKDYAGSEGNTYTAIRQLESLKKYRQLYSCYNNLGIINYELGQYDQAIEEHEKALNYLKKAKIKNILVPVTLNNKGLVYRDQEKYNEAIAVYKEAQDHNDEYTKNKEWEAILIDNIAYAKFKMRDTADLPDMFYRALKIKDSLNIVPQIVTSKLHLAEYYMEYKDTINALKFAYEARDMAISSNRYKNLLTALSFLSKLEKTEIRVAYLNDYIRVKDSLQKVEDDLKDKFSRIRFQTDKLISEKERIRRTLGLTVYLSLGVIAFGGLLFIVVVQQSKNRKLRLEQAQRDFDLKTYNLLLNEQTKIEEGRKEERKRISEELHDGVLGRMFGIRLLLNGLNIRTDEAAIEKRARYMEELHDIEKEIRNVSHELNAQSLVTWKGFTTLINNLLETHSKISKFTFYKKGDNDIDWETIPGIVKANLYRIIQESVHNINKYAKATLVGIEFEEDDKMLSIAISDNGVGFDMNRKKSGIGIKNMRSRVAILKGRIAIESVKNKGTKINIVLPLNL